MLRICCLSAMRLSPGQPSLVSLAMSTSMLTSIPVRTRVPHPGDQVPGAVQWALRDKKSTDHPQ